jgi:hypothetical protein
LDCGGFSTAFGEEFNAKAQGKLESQRWSTLNSALSKSVKPV